MSEGGVCALFATDGSPGAAAALDLLADLPLRPHDEIVVVSYPAFFLVARPDDGGLVTGGLVSRLMERRLGRAREVVEAAVADLAAKGFRATGVVQDGEDAVDAVLRAADERRADLIVVGSRGLGPVRTLVLGSTARALVMVSPIPVLVVRDRRAAPRRILAAVDGSEASRAALALLGRLPLPLDAAVELLHVIPPRGWSELGPGMDGEILDLREATDREDAEKAEALVRRAAAALPAAWRLSTHVERGHVPDTILSRAAATDADLVVLGSRGLAGPRAPFWGSTAERVIAGAPCPVLVSPPTRSEAGAARERRGERAAI